MMKLYVFLRSDLESMTPGKAAAQVAHAASQHTAKMHTVLTSQSSIDYRDWIDGAHLFGTTIVLDGGTFYPDVNDRVKEAHIKAKTLSALYPGREGIVTDPSYPIRDGKVIHHLNLITCTWIFVNDVVDVELSNYIKNNFNLYTGNHD